MVCPFYSKMPTGIFLGTLLEIWPSLICWWHVILCREYIYYQIITHLYQHGSDEPEFIYFCSTKKILFYVCHCRSDINVWLYWSLVVMWYQFEWPSVSRWWERIVSGASPIVTHREITEVLFQHITGPRGVDVKLTMIGWIRALWGQCLLPMTLIIWPKMQLV